MMTTRLSWRQVQLHRQSHANVPSLYSRGVNVLRFICSAVACHLPLPFSPRLFPGSPSFPFSFIFHFLYPLFSTSLLPPTFTFFFTHLFFLPQHLFYHLFCCTQVWTHPGYWALAPSHLLRLSPAHAFFQCYALPSCIPPPSPHLCPFLNRNHIQTKGPTQSSTAPPVGHSRHWEMRSTWKRSSFIPSRAQNVRWERGWGVALRRRTGRKLKL